MKRVLLIFFIATINLGCDQISKNVVRNHIELNQFISVIGDSLILTKVENTGAAMSLGSNLSPIFKILLLQIIPLIALLWLVNLAIVRTNYSRLKILGLASIMGGGIGNLYDRIINGSVTDFIFIDLGGVFKTGIFNLADVSVTVGVLLFIADSLFSSKKESFVNHGVK